MRSNEHRGSVKIFLGLLLPSLVADSSPWVLNCRVCRLETRMDKQSLRDSAVASSSGSVSIQTPAPP